METILIISEKSNHEVKAITAYLPADSWFHIVLDVIHSRYEILMDVKEGTFSVKDIENEHAINSAQLKSLWIARLDNLYEEGFLNNAPLAKFFSSEYFSLIEGIITCAEKQGALIVAHPDASQIAGNKVRQQIVAASLGMKLPEQIIANRSMFLLKLAWKNKAVFKPIHSSNLHYGKDGRSYMSKPVILTKELLGKIKNNTIDMTLSYFQEHLIFKAEYRVVVFGKNVFTFKITGKYKIDWRNYLNTVEIKYQKKFMYSKECLAYNAHFNLTLACFDFIETKDGMFFIECNPPGYFQFCDPENEVGMLGAFARFLMNEKMKK